MVAGWRHGGVAKAGAVESFWLLVAGVGIVVAAAWLSRVGADVAVNAPKTPVP